MTDGRRPYLGVRQQQTVGVLVLAGHLVLRQHVGELLHEGHHFLVPGDVCHGQTAGRALAAVRHTLHTNRHNAELLLRKPPNAVDT